MPGEIGREVRDRWLDFLTTHVNADAAARDETRSSVSREVVAEAARRGLLGYLLPDSVGGRSMSPLAWGVLIEHVARACDDFNFPILIGTFSLVARSLAELGRSDLDDRYVKPMLRGELLGAWSYAGARELRAAVREERDRFVLDAPSTVATAGLLADVFVVYARNVSTTEVQAFLVRRDDPGVAVTPAVGHGVRTAALAAITVTSVELGRDRLLVGAGGIRHAEQFLAMHRARRVCSTLGRMWGITEKCIHLLLESKWNGAVVAGLLNVRSSLGRMYSAVESSRTVVYQTLARLDWHASAEQWERAIELAMFYVSDQALQIDRSIMQLLGGHHVDGSAFERYFRDSLSMLTRAGAQDGFQLSLATRVSNHPSPPTNPIAVEVRQRFGSFIETRVNTGAAERDAIGAPIDRDLLVEAARIGMLSFGLPREVGGEGRDAASVGYLLEEIGALSEDNSFNLLAGLFPSVADAIAAVGREDLVERYVRPIAAGRMFASFCYSEGADPFSFRSTVRKTDRGLLLNGKKELVSGAMMADLFVVYVTQAPGDLAVVLVERTDPGVSVVPEPVLGVRSAGLASLVLRDVEVPRDRMIVPVDGLSHAQAYLNGRRLGVTCVVAGGMRRMLAEAASHVRHTSRYGQPLAEFDNIRAFLGRGYASVEVSRMMLHRALDRLAWEGFDPRWDSQITLAKYFVSEQAIELARSILRVVGTAGYKRGPYERYMRDVLSLTAAAGTQDLLEVNLGMEVVRGAQHRPA